MKNNIKNVAMYIMAVVIVALCNIAAVMLYFAAAIIRFGIRLIEACIDRAPIVIGAVTMFEKKLAKKLAEFFINLWAKIKIYAYTIAKYVTKAMHSVIDTVSELIYNADSIYGNIKNKISTITMKIASDVKSTKKYINFEFDNFSARHDKNSAALSRIKSRSNTIQDIKRNIHEAIEFRKAIMAECRCVEN